MKKKVLIFHSALAPYRLDYFNILADIFDCTVVFLSRNNRNQNFEQKALLEKANFKYAFLDTKFVIQDRDLNLGYVKYLKKLKPDIVIGGEFGLPLLIPYFFRFFSSKPYRLYTISDDSVDIAVKCKGLRKVLRNFFAPRIEGLILLSKPVANWYSNLYNLENEPIVFPILRNENQYHLDLRNCINISNKYVSDYELKGKQVYLYVGRLNKVKNISQLLDAFDNIAMEDDRLIVVGDGIDNDSLLKQKESLLNKDLVYFPGRFEGEELLAWYNVADVFILPSLYEPFGAVVNEALAAGCYVICSQYAGASSLIECSNGYIFNPNIKGDLELKILDLKKKIQTKTSKDFIKPKESLMTISMNDSIESLKTI